MTPSDSSCMMDVITQHWYTTNVGKQNNIQCNNEGVKAKTQKAFNVAGMGKRRAESSLDQRN